MKKTFASLFSGGELVGVGAMQAGLVPIWGVECNPSVAAVAEMNTASKMVVARAQDVDFSEMESPFWLHASPECKRASVANTDGEESEEDVSQAISVDRALRALLPEWFSLENVWAYRNFKSFVFIVSALQSLGYKTRFWHLNSANYGVPQTRRRLILVASRSSIPQRPRATHTNRPQQSLFDSLPPWRGWYEAIEDILDALPECDFAEWQHRRLPEHFAGSCLVGGGNSNMDKIESKARLAQEPAFTVAGCNMLRNNRAFIVHPTADNDWFVVRTDDEPVFTVKNKGLPRAFILGDQKAKGGTDITSRDGEHRMFTVDTRRASKLKAFIVDGKPKNFAGDLQVIEGNSPDGTVTASQLRHPFRAYLSHGRIVQMTVRANARFQSIPDSYVLPDDNQLASMIIGNAVPPLLMQRIVGSNLRGA